MEKLGAVIRYFVLCGSDFCVCWGGGGSSGPSKDEAGDRWASKGGCG